MDPTVTILKEDSILEFRLQANISIANALRRILLSDIPMVIIKTSNYDENKCTIKKNTSRFTNEMIKQRISCIPIHVKPDQIDLEDYYIECKVSNNSNEIIYVTTKDFKVIHKDSNKLFNDIKLFPPDSITKNYIDLIRLKPRISESIPGEEIDLECTMEIGTAKDNSSYNAASKVAYKMTPDITKANQEWESTKLSNSTDLEKKNWFLLQGNRFVIKDHFDFKLETVGVYSNNELIRIACNILIQKLDNLANIIDNGKLVINKSIVTLDNCFDIILQNEDNTLGKLLEYILYSLHFENDKTITYVAFKKLHPHDNDSLLRIAFKDTIEFSIIHDYLNNTINELRKIFNKIKEYF